MWRTKIKGKKTSGEIRENTHGEICLQQKFKLQIGAGGDFDGNNQDLFSGFVVTSKLCDILVGNF
jgi:hypothetical protein